MDFEFGFQIHLTLRGQRLHREGKCIKKMTLAANKVALGEVPIFRLQMDQWDKNSLIWPTHLRPSLTSPSISHVCNERMRERERERERGKGGRVFWEVLFMTITGAHALKIRSLLQVILNRCHCNMILWYNENMSEKAKKGTLSHHNLSQDCKGRAPKSKERGVWLGGWQEEKKGRSREIIAR